MTGSRPPEKRPTTSTPAAGQQKPPGSMTSLVQSIVDEQKQAKEDLRSAIENPKKHVPWKPVALATLIVLNLGAWIIFPPKRDTSGDIRSLVEVERDLRVGIAAVAGDIEIWRKSHNNSVPPSLAAANIRDTSKKYVVIDSMTYEVRGTDKGISSTYRSNMRLIDFVEATPGIKR